VIYLLDTDHISLMQRGTAEGAIIWRHLRTIAPDDYGTTIVTYEGQCRGWLDKINRARTRESRLFGYAELKGSLALFSSIAVVEYNAAADALVTTWERAKIRVSTKDSRIAAIAIANNATLLSRNTRDFARIPGLMFEDWTV